MSDQEGHEGRIAKNAGVLVALTMVSRVGGLARELAISHFFGASRVTDMYFIAFTIPNVLRRLVAEGTLTAVVQPAYQSVRIKDGDDAARRFAGAVLGLLLTFVVGLVIAGILAAPVLVAAFASGFVDEPDKFAQTVELTRWLFPVVIAMSFVGLAMALLNAHDVYAVPALAPIVLNISMIGFTVLGALTFERPVFGIVAGVLVGGLLEVLVQLPSLFRRRLLGRPRIDLKDAVVRATLGRFVPGLFGLAVYQLNIIVLRTLASWTPEGGVSYYNYADRIMELAVGVFAVAIAQGSFSTMNAQAARGELDALKATWRFSMLLTTLVAIPAALGLAALAVPIVSVLFHHGQFDWADVAATAATAIAFAPGLVAISTTRATANVFYALEDQRTPVKVSAVVLVSNALIGVALLRFGIVALAATLSISSFIQTGLLVFLLRKKIGPLGMKAMLQPLALQVGLGIVAVAAAWGLAFLGDWQVRAALSIDYGRNVAVLFGAIGVAVVLYGAAAVALRMEGVSQLADKVLRKLRRHRSPT